MNKGLHPDSEYKIILVSAPAGFGKTPLVSEWIHQTDKSVLNKHFPVSVVWLSLDEGDNDLPHFLMGPSLP